MTSVAAAGQTLAGRLVRAFGDVTAMAAMYAEDVVWTLSKSLGPAVAGPHVGKAATIAFNRFVWTDVYVPASVTVEVLDEIGGEDGKSAVRFIYRARRFAGQAYENEYTVFVRSRDGMITEVFEALDTRRASGDVG